jgi:hypothetical protein
LGPTLNRHPSSARVESDRDLPRIVARGLPYERRIAHRRSSDNDAGDTFLQPRFNRRGITDSPAQLDGDADQLEDAVNGCAIHWLAGERAIEVDNVKIFESLLLKRTRLRSGIPMKDGGAGHIALLKTDGQSFLEIDCRKQNHGFHFKKFAIKARPSRWLFSG